MEYKQIREKKNQKGNIRQLHMAMSRAGCRRDEKGLGYPAREPNAVTGPVDYIHFVTYGEIHWDLTGSIRIHMTWWWAVDISRR